MAEQRPNIRDRSLSHTPCVGKLAAARPRSTGGVAWCEDSDIALRATRLSAGPVNSSRLEVPIPSAGLEKQASSSAVG